MTLFKLVYCSRPVAGTDLADVQEILSVARQRNPDFDLTGFLAFRHDLFAQVLEGDRGHLSRLFARIASDRRHEDVVLLDYGPIEKRTYADWSMGFVSLGAVSRATILKYSSHGDLDFEAMTGEAVASLLYELSTTATSPGEGRQVPRASAA